MNTTRIYLSILFILSFIVSKAEITNGVTNVYFKPGKNIAFRLYNNVKIECGAPDGKWQSIVIYLPSKKGYFDSQIKVKKGDPIIDSTGKKIGYIVSDQIDAMPMYDKIANSYTMRLAGYIIKDDVKANSILENELAQIINSNKKDLSINSFKRFISNFELVKYKDDLDKKYPSDINYVLWYDTYVTAPTVFRIQLIFSHEKLIAIFHATEIKNTGFLEMKTNTNNLMWIKNNNSTEMKKMANAYHKIYEVPD
jgi:hypothetical protein